jgi:two-component system sensor histidine kinase and response regulator WspE
MTALDLSQLSMHELFRAEAENQSQVLTAGLLALERNPTGPDHLEACMRAAHSLKGAARIVDIGAGVTLAHAMEDFFVAAQQGRVTLNQEQIDRLLQGVDLMMAIATAPDSLPGQALDLFVTDLGRLLKDGDADALTLSNAVPDRPSPAMPSEGADQTASIRAEEPRENSDRALRVSVDNLNRLLGLAGESLVESRWLKPFGQSLLRLKRLHYESARSIQSLCEGLPQGALDERAQAALAEVQLRVLACQKFLADRLTEL